MRSIRYSAKPTVSSIRSQISVATPASVSFRTVHVAARTTRFQPTVSIRQSVVAPSIASSVFENRHFTTTRLIHEENKESQEKTTENTQTQEENEKEVSVDQLKEKLETLEQEKADLEKKYNEARDGWTRAVADAENTRKISQRNIEEGKKFALQGFAKDLLEVADNLGRALTSVPEKQRQENEELATLFDGVTMTEQVLFKILNKHGIEQFKSMGEQFDPNIHEALFETRDPEKESGVVTTVIQEGYKLNDRVIRAAKIGVNRKD